MGYDIEKEKREAIEAGRRALNSLQAAKENLNSAKNWGLVDMFGGGFFTTMLKHSKMDQAKRNMEQAKYDLRNFSRELNDVNMACNLNIDTGDFLSFADYFFDGFVVDWVVQDRINNAKRQVPFWFISCHRSSIFSTFLPTRRGFKYSSTTSFTARWR